MIPNSVPYADVARGRLTQDDGQDFPTSTFRHYTKEPVGPSHFRFLMDRKTRRTLVVHKLERHNHC
jgi:hypothetical protein